MVNIGDVFGYGNELKTFLTIFKRADIRGKQILKKQIKSNLNYFQRLVNEENVPDLSVSEISILTELDIFELNQNLIDILSLIPNERNRFCLFKKIFLTGSNIRNHSCPFNPRKITCLFQNLDYLDEVVEFIKKEKRLEYVYKFLAFPSFANEFIEFEFLSSKSGLYVLEKILDERKLEDREIKTLVKAYIAEKENGDDLNSFSDLLKRKNMEKEFNKELMKIAL